MQFFLMNCTHILTRTQGEKFEDMLLVKIASKGTSLTNSVTPNHLLASVQINNQSALRLVQSFTYEVFCTESICLQNFNRSSALLDNSCSLQSK